MLMKCQGSRIEEQRSFLPMNSVNNPVEAAAAAASVASASNPSVENNIPMHAPTVPDEDFFSLIQRLQAGRLEDQRASLPKS